MKKASMGARIGALILDSLFLDFINLFLILYNPYSLFLVSPFVTFLYFGICEGSSMSASLGKKICGLVVVDEEGNKLSSAKGFTRSICRLVSGLILGIGYLIALFDVDNKALHDKMAGTFVADATSLKVESVMAHPTNKQQKPCVISIAGPFAGKAFPVTEQGITFGRDRNLCDVVYSENTKGISRIHCKVLYNTQTNMFILYDMGSTYGTFLENGKRITQDQPMALRVGEGFYLASNINLFRTNL